MTANTDALANAPRRIRRTELRARRLYQRAFIRGITHGAGDHRYRKLRAQWDSAEKKAVAARRKHREAGGVDFAVSCVV